VSSDERAAIFCALPQGEKNTTTLLGNDRRLRRRDNHFKASAVLEMKREVLQGVWDANNCNFAELNFQSSRKKSV
jgi:hypothetical protein